MCRGVTGDMTGSAAAHTVLPGTVTPGADHRRVAAEAEIIITGEIHGTSAVNQEGAPVRAVIVLAAAYRILFLRLLQALREKSLPHGTAHRAAL